MFTCYPGAMLSNLALMSVTYALVAAALPSCARAPVATFCALRSDEQVLDGMHGY